MWYEEILLLRIAASKRNMLITKLSCIKDKDKNKSYISIKINKFHVRILMIFKKGFRLSKYYNERINMDKNFLCL